MTSVAKSTPTLAALWKQTEGTPEQRTKSLLRLAEGVPAIAGNALLKQIRDLAADGTFEHVTKIFDAPARANRKHNVKADGMRAGGFASVHQTNITAGPVASVEPCREPAELARFNLYSIGGMLSDAQRQWCAATMRGEKQPFPPAVPISTMFLLKATAIALEPVTIGEPGPTHDALIRCALANITCKQTQTEIDTTLREGPLQLRTQVLRAAQVLESINERTPPGRPKPAESVPTNEWRKAMRASNAGELAESAAREAYEAGDLEHASMLLRIVVKFGYFVADEVHLKVGAAHFIKSGALHDAADELKLVPRDKLLERTIETLQAGSIFSAAHLKELDEHYPDALRKPSVKAVRSVSLGVALEAPTPLNVDALIARGSAAAPKASLSDVEMAKAMSELRLALLNRGNAHETMSAGVDISSRARLRTPELDTNVDWAFSMLRGRGASLVRRIDSVDSGPSISLQQRTIDVGNEVEASMAGEHIFYLLGHTAESSDAALRQAAVAFRDRRSDGVEKVQTTSGEQREIHVGSFFKASVGHIHPGGNTEVFSTGFQAFASAHAMADFYRRDPEHFALVLGYLLT